MDVAVSVGASATVGVPGTGPDDVTEGGRPARETEGITLLRVEDGTAFFRVESGTYRFASKAPGRPGRTKG